MCHLERFLDLLTKRTGWVKSHLPLTPNVVSKRVSRQTTQVSVPDTEVIDTVRYLRDTCSLNTSITYGS